MNKLANFKPQTYTPKKVVDKDGYDEAGVLHEDCGTPECCNECEPEETILIERTPTDPYDNDEYARSHA